MLLKVGNPLYYDKGNGEIKGRYHGVLCIKRRFNCVYFKLKQTSGSHFMKRLFKLYGTHNVSTKTLSKSP